MIFTLTRHCTSKTEVNKMLRSVHEFNGSLVFIMSCADCNTKCQHCYLPYSDNFSGDELYEVASLLSEKYEVRINGSEPLMHKDFLKTLKKVNQYSVMTNGLVFKENYDYLEEIKATGIKELAISYHFDLHERISAVPKDFLENLFHEILGRGLKVRINCSLSKENFKKVREYCDFCINLGIQKIRFTNFLRQGKANQLENALFLDTSDRMKFFDIIDSVRKDIPKESLIIERCGSFGRNPKKHNFFCGGGINNIAIAPDLKVYPCVFLIQPEYEIGFYDNGKIYINNKFIYSNEDCPALIHLNQ